MLRLRWFRAGVVAVSIERVFVFGDFVGYLFIIRWIWTVTRGLQMKMINDDDENVPLNYSINNDLSIQFGREEFCLLTGLRFGVENREEYDTQANLPFRRRVFRSNLDGNLLRVRRIDVMSDGLLRIANDRVAWNKYPWGSYVWPTLYSQLRNATVRRWGPLYVDKPTNEDDQTTYSIFGYTWAFKGHIPIARLTPDDIEARSDWWISSKAYFDGFIDQVERVPFNLSRHNMYEIPSGVYRQFVEQKIELERNKKDVHDIKEEMQKFREEMNAIQYRLLLDNIMG
ncbi:hypothetical protein Tco_0568511 [Tanacetum coccineum]